MSYHNAGCLGDYDFYNIAQFARRRFIEGEGTMEMLVQAKTEKEKEEIALVAILDLDDNGVENIRLHCKYADECEVTNCRRVLKELIEKDMLV